MREKKIVTLLVAVLMSVMMLPGVAVFGGTVYTVTLKAGAGIGNDIVYKTTFPNPGTIPTYSQAQNYQFFITDNGKLGFKLPNMKPDSFTAPPGCVFESWDQGGSYWLLNGLETTVTAKWHEDNTATLGPIQDIPPRL